MDKNKKKYSYDYNLMNLEGSRICKSNSPAIVESFNFRVKLGVSYCTADIVTFIIPVKGQGDE